MSRGGARAAYPNRSANRQEPRHGGRGEITRCARPFGAAPPGVDGSSGGSRLATTACNETQADVGTLRALSHPLRGRAPHIRAAARIGRSRVMAEGVGFEPTVPVKGRQFSRLEHSTALPPFRQGAHATKNEPSGPIGPSRVPRLAPGAKSRWDGTAAYGC